MEKEQLIAHRNEFLKRCQICSTLPNRVYNIKTNVPANLRVSVKGAEYYPYKYQIGFDNVGKPIHTAVLHDLKTNSVISCSLDKILFVDKE